MLKYKIKTELHQKYSFSTNDLGIVGMMLGQMFFDIATQSKI